MSAEPIASLPATTTHGYFNSDENVITRRDSRGLLDKQVVATSYAALTHTVSTANIDDVTDFRKWVESVLYQAETDTGGRFCSKRPTCVVGLHTCGDLGGVALRLFPWQPQLRAVCVVGCCYHHITERDGLAGI